MDELKEAFRKIKGDLLHLKEEVSFLKKDLQKTQEGVIEIGRAMISLDREISLLKSIQTEKPFLKAQDSLSPIDTSLFTPQKPQISTISKGNDGVQTDRQTNQQTDKQIEKGLFISSKTSKVTSDSFKTASELLESLDSLKKEIRLKFKRLTEQELITFSTIYQIEEERGFCDYKSLSGSLKISESSVRDYVRRLLLKEIPIEKSKVNNKEVHLFISPNLKKIASLSTILRLVDL
jgi:hypothetical protein